MQTINTMGNSGEGLCGRSYLFLSLPCKTAVLRSREGLCCNYRGPLAKGRRGTAALAWAARHFHPFPVSSRTRRGLWGGGKKKNHRLPGPEELRAIFLRRPSPEKPSESIRVHGKLCHSHSPWTSTNPNLLPTYLHSTLPIQTRADRLASGSWNSIYVYREAFFGLWYASTCFPASLPTYYRYRLLDTVEPTTFFSSPHTD